MNCNIKSLYLCVTDMNRAIEFYEKLFDQTVTVHDDLYSVFDIHGFRLGLFAFQKVNEPHVFGSNCLPSIEVNNLDILRSKNIRFENCISSDTNRNEQGNRV
jgi:predicted enzyme related to lactoylglutathione lyase